MKDCRKFFNVVKVVLLFLFMFAIIGTDGCNCSKPFIEKVEVWIDRNTEDNVDDVSFEEQVIPVGLTYKIPKNTSFRIKIKTQEPLSDNELAESKVYVTSSISIYLKPLEGEDNIYVADYDNLTGTLGIGIYNVVIVILHSGKIISQSITIQIEQSFS
ncbi:hypothetical protein H5T89_00305 [bacterium]|nr:hypothetical protein [bacterium]